MKKIRLIVLSGLVMLGLSVTPTLLASSTASAACDANSTPQECADVGANSTTTEKGRTKLTDQIKTIVNAIEESAGRTLDQVVESEGFSRYEI